MDLIYHHAELGEGWDVDFLAGIRKKSVFFIRCFFVFFCPKRF